MSLGCVHLNAGQLIFPHFLIGFGSPHHDQARSCYLQTCDPCLRAEAHCAVVRTRSGQDVTWG